MFLILALFWTAPLRGLNRIWMQFGLMLYGVINPVVMAFLFYSTVVPMGLMMRAFGRDALRLKRHKGAASYWALIFILPQGTTELSASGRIKISAQ
jgi:hypothetical protein